MRIRLLAASVLPLLPLLAGPAHATPGPAAAPAAALPLCTLVTAQVMSDALVPAFSGLPVPPGTYKATYAFGTMKRYYGQTGWDVQHYTPSGFYPDRGIFAVDVAGTTYQKLPGNATNSPTQAAAEAANAGATAWFSWPGGSMFVKHVDNPHSDNTPGTRQPSWEICGYL